MRTPSPGSSIRRRMVRVPVLAVGLLAVLSVVSCSMPQLDRQLIAGRESGRLPDPEQAGLLKAHLLDGGVLLLQPWSVDPASGRVRGQGQRVGPDRALSAQGDLSVPLDSVALFEIDTLRTSDADIAMTAMTLVSGVVTVACLANPKACFGSCPTFYVQSPAGSGEWTLVAEGFSSSVAPSLEQTDVDALWAVRTIAAGPRFTLRVTNEAYETHAIRRADLLLVPVATDQRAGVDGEGRFHVIDEQFAPIAARSEAGDELHALIGVDGIERSSPADEHDLAARETIDLTYEVPALRDAQSASRYALVLHFRQSLLTTWLFYQSLAYLGSQAGHWLAELERGDASTRERTSSMGRALGGIEVQLRERSTSGGWRTVYTVHETGPLARDVELVPLGEFPPGRVDIRLRFTRGMWRLDHVGLARVSPSAPARRVRPARVFRVIDGEAHADEAALAALLDEDRVLVTLPGDTLDIEYAIEQGDFARYEVLLESRGWYLEWIRKQWLAEENLPAAISMLAAPQWSLRTLAPAYKLVEPEMDALFWGSRYARP